MHSYRKFLVFAALLLAVLLHSGICQEDERRERFLQDVLRELSKRTGDVFALERWANASEAPTSSTAVIDLAMVNQYTAPEKLIPAYFPDFRVEKSGSNPRLFFVFDRRLEHEAGRPLLGRIPAQGFKGSEREWAGKLAETVELLKMPDVTSLPDINRIGIRSGLAKLDLIIQQCDARHALTACVDTLKTRGIAWIATSRVKNGKVETEVNYTMDAVFIEKP